MKMIVSEMLDINDGLKEINDISKDKNSRSSITYPMRLKTGRGIKALKNEMDAYNETQKELLEQHGTENEEQPGNFKLGKNAKLFQDELQPILDSEVNLPALSKSHFKASEFRNVPLSVDAQMGLEIITEMDVDENGKKKVEPKKGGKK